MMWDAGLSSRVRQRYRLGAPRHMTAVIPQAPAMNDISRHTIGGFQARALHQREGTELK